MNGLTSDQAKRHPRAGRKGGWKLFFAEVWRRCAGAWRNPVFFLYFFGIVVGVAGFGIWITLGRFALTIYPDATARALALAGIFESAATYAVAISATALADIFLASNKNSPNAQEIQTIPRSVFILCFILTGIVVICLAGAFFFPIVETARLCAVVATVVGLFQWWLINADNPALADDDDPSQFIGSDPNRPLPGDLGAYSS